MYIYEQSVKDTLKKNGYKYTPERAEIINVLGLSDSPLSITELSNLTKYNMNATTVYRNIEVFEKLGIISKIYTGWKFRIELSNKFQKHHHHLTCIKCSNIIDFDEPKDFEDYLQNIVKSKNFKIIEHSLELRGLCHNCNKPL